MKNAIAVYDNITDRLHQLAPIGQLIARLSLGGMFLSAGWGKLHSLEGVTGFFQELGIPAAAFNAHLVATTEFVGGIALLVGLGTRLASIPLAITMTVAIFTARMGDVEGVLSFLGLEEFTYLAVLVWLTLSGAGKLSLDALITRKTHAKINGGPSHGRLATEY